MKSHPGLAIAKDLLWQFDKVSPRLLSSHLSHMDFITLKKALDLGVNIYKVTSYETITNDHVTQYCGSLLMICVSV